MKHKNILPIIETLKDLSHLEISDMNVAENIVELMEICVNIYNKDVEVLRKMVVYSDEEKAYKQKLEELQKNTNKDNREEMKLEFDKLENESKELIKSIEEKEERFKELVEERGELPVKEKLPPIPKKALMNNGKLKPGIKLLHIAALKPVLKD